MSESGIDAEALKAAVTRHGADGLENHRSAALARFLAEGLPTTRDEEWKYTSLAHVAAKSVEWLAAEAAETTEPAPADIEPAVDGITLRIADGRIGDDDLSSFAAALGGGASVRRLSEIADARELYMANPLASLNAALMDDAICLDIPAGVEIDRPLILDLCDSAGDGRTMRSRQVRLLINAGERASAEFVELDRSAAGGAGFAGTVVQIALARGAKVAYGRIQERSDEDTRYHRIQAELGGDSQLVHAGIDLGGRVIRNDVAAILKEPGASVDSAGLFLAGGDRHVDNHILADHRVGPTVSRQDYRGIAGGHARCVYNGKAMVHPGADGTDAEQSSHNLLLSNRAEIDTKPELEIYAEDVRCNHGATVGQLDEQALFYLRSRGIEQTRARQLLIRAFAASLLAKFPVAALAEYLADATERALDRLDGEPAA